MTTLTQPAANPTAWPRDLAWLAWQAATELDNLLLGKPASSAGVRDLSFALVETIGGPSGSSGPSSLVDPTRTVVLTRALRDSHLAGRNLEDLVRVTVGLVKQLREAAHPADGVSTEHRKSLELLRGFCLALSKHAAAERHHAANRPKHPFQR